MNKLYMSKFMTFLGDILALSDFGIRQLLGSFEWDYFKDLGTMFSSPWLWCLINSISYYLKIDTVVRSNVKHQVKVDVNVHQAMVDTDH